MARVLFIQPNYDIDKPGMTPWMPIALVELATFIREKGKHRVKILDRNLYPQDSILINTLKSFNPDIVGMTCYTSPVIKDILKVSKIVKGNSKSKVIGGGIHATIEPKSLLDVKTIDYIVRGEGELALLEICELIDKKKDSRKNMLKIQNVNYNSLRPLIDLNILPVPDYNLLEVRKYPVATFYTSRGCMGRCRFCYNLGRQLRFYNTDKVIKLITGVLNKYKIKEFTLADDNFANLGERTTRICDALSRYNVIFHCFLRADQTHDEVMKNLKKAGCWTIQFGFESGSQRVLDFINKRTKVEQNVKAIKQCKKYGIFVDGSFMMGLPTETEEEMNQTVRFIEKYKPDALDIKIYKPYPKTELYNLCVEKGLLTEPKTIEEWIPFCDFNDGEPNLSEIPTQRLLETINRYSKPSNLTYIKKFVLLILNGHIKYPLFKFKGVMTGKINNLLNRQS